MAKYYGGGGWLDPPPPCVHPWSDNHRFAYNTANDNRREENIWGLI